MSLLRTVIDDKRNPALKFGVTVYEDELSSRLLSDLPAELRARVDRVSLYLHYRGGAQQYSEHVRKTRQLLGNAQLFGGIYAYDRIDYLPCAAALDQLHAGAGDGIVPQPAGRADVDAAHRSARRRRVYPGNFGAEQQWSGWSKAAICKAVRRDACVKSTLEMRKTALSAVQRARDVSKTN